MCGSAPDSTPEVLVASSHPEVREAARRALAAEQLDRPLRVVGTAEELLARASLAPAVVLLDATLSGFGPELLVKLRKDRACARSAVVLLVDSDRIDALLGAHAGLVDDFMLAPCGPEELSARLRLSRGRLEAKRRMEAQAQTLQSLNERQTEFLSVVSHEIRTPLSAIMSSAGILKRYGRARPESVERFAGVIQEETRRLTRLINNLLDLAKIEAGQVEWHVAPTRVTELLELLKDSFAALIGERALTLEVSHDQSPPEVVVDRDKMIQVLANLLSNAVKHSPDGGAVHLRCGVGEHGALRLEVEDEGPGIPPGQEERIFGRFQQLEVGDERTGTGLGLNISRQIVEHHGGRIWAEPGRTRGALLVVELPIRAGGEAGHGAV